MIEGLDREHVSLGDYRLERPGSAILIKHPRHAVGKIGGCGLSYEGRFFWRSDLAKLVGLIEATDEKLLNLCVLSLLKAFEDLSEAQNLPLVGLQAQSKCVSTFVKQRVQHLPVAQSAEWTGENVQCLAFNELGEKGRYFRAIMCGESFERGGAELLVFRVGLFQNERQAFFVFAQTPDGSGLYIG